jgi:hypothetical protein
MSNVYDVVLSKNGCGVSGRYMVGYANALLYRRQRLLAVA